MIWFLLGVIFCLLLFLIYYYFENEINVQKRKEAEAIRNELQSKIAYLEEKVNAHEQTIEDHRDRIRDLVAELKPSSN